jgi:threonine dehydratase
MELRRAGVDVVGVQPRANCAMHDSLRDGVAYERYVGGDTICDGLAGAVASRMVELVRAHVSGVVLVDEEQVLAAMAFAWRTLGLVMEPSAAVGVAAVRAGAAPCDGETVVVVTGANVDAEVLDRALAAE